MSLAGAQGSTWAVEGGNKLVCSGLLKLTKANVIHGRVTGVSLHSSGEPHRGVCSSPVHPWVLLASGLWICAWRGLGGDGLMVLAAFSNYNGFVIL